ncbi:hypothetical protein F8S12_35215 [Nostoc sp. WHI]|nr:hypothetical protein [Nostoc sp. WHI]
MRSQAPPGNEESPRKNGTGIKVSLFKGDLEGSKTFDTDKRTFQTSSKAYVIKTHIFYSL